MSFARKRCRQPSSWSMVARCARSFTTWAARLLPHGAFDCMICHLPFIVNLDPIGSVRLKGSNRHLKGADAALENARDCGRVIDAALGIGERALVGKPVAVVGVHAEAPFVRGAAIGGFVSGLPGRSRRTRALTVVAAVDPIA